YSELHGICGSIGVVHPRRACRAISAGQLLHGVAASLQKRHLGAEVVVTFVDGLVRRDAAAGYGWIKSGLAHCPAVTLVVVFRLLLGRLSVFRVDEELIAWGCLRRAGGFYSIRWCHDLIFALAAVPQVIRVVGI